MTILRIKLSDIYTLVAIWCYLLMPSLLPMPAVSGFVLVLAIRLLSVRFFSDIIFEWKFDRQFWILFGSFFGLLGALQFDHLFLPLNSDEPHHAERALFLLKAAFDWIATGLGLNPNPSLQGSFWSMLDPRLMSAGVVWQLLFWVFVLILGCIFCLWRGAYARITDSKSRVGVDVVALLAIAGLGWGVYGWPDPHPPLRTLVPFLSAGILGLDDFSFRISGLVAISFFAVWLNRKIEGRFGSVQAFLYTLLSVGSPIILFNSLVLEPAVYAFIGWAVVLFLFLEAYEQDDEKLFKSAVLLIPVFVLCRHTCIFLVIPAAILYAIKFWRKVSIPWPWILPFLLLCIPYGYALKTGGNAVGSVDFGIQKIGEVLANGKPIMSIFNSMGPLWTFVLILVLALSFLHIKKLHWLVVSWVLSFFIYHLVSIDTAWGIARYQVEFIVAPMIVTALWLLNKHRLNLQAGVAACLILIAASIFQIRSIPDDIEANDFQAQRITNTSFFPIDRAVNYLHRKKVGHEFLVFGGIPPSFESVLWFQGYNLLTARNWLGQFYEFQQLMGQSPSWEMLDQYFKARQIKYLVVHNGLNRDLLGMAEPMKKIVTDISQNKTGTVKLRFERTFESPLGGILDLYQVE